MENWFRFENSRSGKQHSPIQIHKWVLDPVSEDKWTVEFWKQPSPSQEMGKGNDSKQYQFLPLSVLGSNLGAAFLHDDGKIGETY